VWMPGFGRKGVETCRIKGGGCGRGGSAGQNCVMAGQDEVRRLLGISAVVRRSP
jgi:hypothetical protein